MSNEKMGLKEQVFLEHRNINGEIVSKKTILGGKESMTENYDENVTLKGVVHHIVRDSEGNVKAEFTKDNLVVNAGKALAAGLLIGTGTAVNNIAIGTGSTNFAATSTQLNNEYARDTATTSAVTTTVAGDTAQFVKTFTFTESKAIVETGLFNNSSGGTMLSAQTFSAVNVVSGDSLQITWKISVA